MKLQSGAYQLLFKNGGVQIEKNGNLLYFNHRPMFVTVKSATSSSNFYDKAYDAITADGDAVVATGTLTLPSGGAFAFTDTYTAAGSSGIKISRSVQVQAVGDEQGFSSKISLTMTKSNDVHDYNCFSPGIWYKQNEFAPDYALGHDLDSEYYWSVESCCALPLFAMQHIATGEAAAICRWASDVGMRSTDIQESENYVDPKFSLGSVGMSYPKPQSLNYTYYGYPYRRDLETVVDGLSLDYVYPAATGEMPRSTISHRNLYSDTKNKRMSRVNHPMEKGFTQSYAVAVQFGQYDGFQPMMREVWRNNYKRMRDDLFPVDNEAHFHNCMRFLTRYTQQYGEAWGQPFSAQLPYMDANTVGFQFGFVGQQPGSGYQLLRYGDKENVPEAYEKGMNVLEFWVRTSLTENGVPQMCYNATIQGYEPYLHWPRMVADGVEAIFDAYMYMRSKGEEKTAWRDYCVTIAEWYLKIQNADGSFYRAYAADNTMRLDSKANTPSPIRFLAQMFLLTGNEAYKQAALKAGEWSYVNAYQNLEYRGGTCDNMDIQDKEAGIYGIFGFLALYDLTGEDKWLQAAIGAADYTETWTYAWKYPIRTQLPHHPFNQYSISGQSIITLGGGADVYAASCAYVYYRLYLITGDDHYRDYAEFVHKNTRQSNDIDGSSGYIMPGIGHESGNFTNQTLRSHYHWLPWCTFVEIDPSSRLYDTFGSYEIAGAEKLPPEEKAKRNRIYDSFA